MCGVFGIRAPDRDVARVAHFALHALQHRGQEAAGIAVSEEGRLTVLRELGLITQFKEQKLRGLHGRHRHRPHALLDDGLQRVGQRPAARPPRPRPDHRARAQREPRQRGARGPSSSRTAPRLSSTSDSELIAAADRKRPAAAEEAVPATMARLEGAYSVTAIADGTLLAFRDPLGFRPLSSAAWGRLGVASETCAFDLLGAEPVREIGRGELVLVDAGGLRAIDSVSRPEEGAFCIFEFFYFARPDSHLARRRDARRTGAHGPAPRRRGAGRGRPRAPDSRLGHARSGRLLARSGIPFSEGLIKNRYVGRTSSSPTRSCASRASG